MINIDDALRDEVRILWTLIDVDKTWLGTFVQTANNIINGDHDRISTGTYKYLGVQSWDCLVGYDGDNETSVYFVPTYVVSDDDQIIGNSYPIEDDDV